MIQETAASICYATIQESTPRRMKLNNRLSTLKRTVRTTLFSALATFAVTAFSHDEQRELNAWLDEEFVAMLLGCEKVTAVKVMTYGPWSTSYLAKCISGNQTTFYTFRINRNAHETRPTDIRKIGE